MRYLMIALLAATPVLADPIEGVWQTQKDDNGYSGHVQIAPCDGGLCGTLVRSFDPAGQVVQSPNTGRAIIWDMQAAGGGRYDGGKVWAPDRDKTYAGKLTLSGDSLDVSGCIMGICRSGGVWRRVD